MSDLKEKIEWLINNDDKAQQIVKNQQEFANQWLTKTAMQDYAVAILN